MSQIYYITWTNLRGHEIFNPWSMIFFCTTYHLFEPYPLKHGYHGFRLLAGIEPRNMQIYRCPLGDFMIKTWGLMVILMDMLGAFFKHMVKFYMLHIFAYFGYLRTPTISCFDPSGLGLNKKHAGRGDTNQTTCNSWDLVCWETFQINPVHFSGNLKPTGVKWGKFIQKWPDNFLQHVIASAHLFWGSLTLEVRHWNVRGATGECEDVCSIILTCTSHGTLQNIERWLIVLGVVILILLCPCPFCCCFCPGRHRCGGGGGGRGGYGYGGRCGCCMLLLKLLLLGHGSK